MAFNEATRDMFELIKYEVVEERPEWEPLDIDRPYEAIFLMVAAVALKGNTYSFEMLDEDGKAEILTIEPMTYDKDENGERFAIAISSNSPGSTLEEKLANTVKHIFTGLQDFSSEEE